jgi:hypothetical protein
VTFEETAKRAEDQGSNLSPDSCTSSVIVRKQHVSALVVPWSGDAYHEKREGERNEHHKMRQFQAALEFHGARCRARQRAAHRIADAQEQSSLEDAKTCAGRC